MKQGVFARERRDPFGYAQGRLRNPEQSEIS
jgi:hypothetical protein